MLAFEHRKIHRLTWVGFPNHFHNCLAGRKAEILGLFSTDGSLCRFASSLVVGRWIPSRFLGRPTPCFTFCCFSGFCSWCSAVDACCFWSFWRLAEVPVLPLIFSSSSLGGVCSSGDAWDAAICSSSELQEDSSSLVVDDDEDEEEDPAEDEELLVEELEEVGLDARELLELVESGLGFLSWEVPRSSSPSDSELLLLLLLQLWHSFPFSEEPLTFIRPSLPSLRTL